MNIKKLGLGVMFILYILLIMNIVTPTDRQDYVMLIENNNGFTDPYTIYQICKPNAEVNADDFDVNFEQLHGGAYSVSFWYNATNMVNTADYGSVQKSYTCNTGIFNYTSNPKYFWCYDANGSVLYEHSFESGDLQTNTSYWIEYGLTGYSEKPFETWKKVTKQNLRNYLNNSPVGKCYKFMVKGHRINNLFMPFAADNIITYNGMDFLEYAWWNSSLFTYRMPIEINCSNELCRKGMTMIVSGINATDGNKFNLTNQNNFALTCDNIEIDKIIGNMSELEVNGSAGTKMFDDSTGYGTNNLTFMFRLLRNVTGVNNTMCYIYYGDLTYNSSYDNKSNIALLYDTFDNAAKWTGNAEISGGVLTGTQAQYRFAKLDVGICADCEKYEILDTTSCTTAEREDFFRTFMNTTPSGNPNQIGSKGIVPILKAGFGEITDASSTGSVIHHFNVTHAVDIDYSTRWVAFDDINKYYWQLYVDEDKKVADITNNSGAGYSDGNKAYLQYYVARSGSRAKYVMVRRYQDEPAIITVGVEETTAPPNNAPDIPDVVIIPSLVYNDTDINCSSATAINDVDGDNMTGYFNHTIDDIYIGEFIIENLLNGTQPSYIINHANYSKGLNVTCILNLYDGTDVSGQNETSVIVLNTAPEFIFIADISLAFNFSDVLLDLTGNISDIDSLDSEMFLMYVATDSDSVLINIDNATSIMNISFIAGGSTGINLTLYDDEGLSNMTSFNIIVATAAAPAAVPTTSGDALEAFGILFA